VQNNGYIQKQSNVEITVHINTLTLERCLKATAKECVALNIYLSIKDSVILQSIPRTVYWKIVFQNWTN